MLQNNLKRIYESFGPLVHESLLPGKPGMRSSSVALYPDSPDGGSDWIPACAGMTASVPCRPPHRRYGCQQMGIGKSDAFAHEAV